MPPLVLDLVDEWTIVVGMVALSVIVSILTALRLPRPGPDEVTTEPSVQSSAARNIEKQGEGIRI